MLSHGILVLAAAALSSAVTPQGFAPASQTDLFVNYGNVAGLNGAVLPRDATQVQPTLSTQQQLTGEFAVVMIDLDIPTNSPPQTNTLLHWLQTGLTSAAQATAINTTTGSRQAFLLQNRANAQPLAMYFGPNPPARIPLSHRYTFILVNHTGITQQGLQALTTAAATRMGFSAETVLQQAGLTNRVVAGNFFNVTNAGNGTAGTGNAFPSGTAGGASPTNTFTTSGAAASSVSVAALGLGLLGALFLGL